MAELNVANVMEQMALRAVSQGIVTRAYGWPVETVQPPCFISAYPDNITYDYTFGRASDRANFKAYIVVGKPTERTARDAISAYVAGSPSGIKDALDGNLNGSCQTARVTDAQIEEVNIGGVAYLALALTIDVIS